MAPCSGCYPCKCLKPRYKWLVDNLYPPNEPEIHILRVPGLHDSIITHDLRNDMEKLKFYADSSPEKIDRIGEYIYARVRNDLAKKKPRYVFISVYVMDKLLLVAHSSQAMNLFDESFLAMIQELLECPDIELQELATESFIKFAYIEEEAPSYHRRYDFLISKFASMCLTNEEDAQKRRALRQAGIKGLEGVIKKTSADDLVVNIWKEVYMQKIVDAILHIIYSSEFCLHCTIASKYQNPDEPGAMAEFCLEELLRTVSFGHMDNLLEPILRYLDSKDIWIDNEFPSYLFHKIIFAIQPKYSCVVFEILIMHLDKNINERDEILNGILGVLYESITISPQENICSNIFEVVNLLVNHLENYLSFKEDMNEYTKSIASCLLGLSSHLSDSQKFEIVIFLTLKVPTRYETRTGLILQKTLLGSKTIDNIPMDMRSRFPANFLEHIIPLYTCLNICRLVQGIFHALLDRHGNIEYFRHPSLPIEHAKKFVCARGDTQFIRDNGDLVYGKTLEALALAGNTLKSYCTFFTTMALIAIELISETTVTEYITAIFSIQEIALTQTALKLDQKVFLHSMCITLLGIVVCILDIESLANYCNTLIKLRKQRAAYLLPNVAVDYAHMPTDFNSELLLDRNVLENLLRNLGLDSNVFDRSVSYRFSWIEEAPSNTFFVKKELKDFNERDLATSFSLPERTKFKYPDSGVAFETIKSILHKKKEISAEDRQKQRELNSFFRTKPFIEIIHTYTSEECLQTKLQTFLNESSNQKNKAGNITNEMNQEIRKSENYEELFPEIFDDYDEHN